MKKRKFLLTAFIVAVTVTGGIIYAADHLDSPAVSNQTTDITDVYVFRGQNTSNLVFVANTQGLLSPSASSMAMFDEKTLIEFNIDNNGDNVEDLVIQAIAKNGKMKVYGPYKPVSTGTKSVISPSAFSVQADITVYGQAAKIGEENGIKVFAGPRDDPFFFDLGQYQKIIGGTASGFNNPGTDTFKGTNVMSIVIEVPKSLLGSTNTINVWAESKKAIN
ncbi:DUF4331 domain-containing protein [Lacibacter luteus]|uniref:DUF4331 domain-containing protein n=1 Tax=Lacibacter luteus TaxID=2508719 RepID=A0A4Q1CGW0_9BACT|nr:DUF4331 family protein [Lacibacter luteus]RXK59408.1 DUF4331 domain-containing protein [Lacibacter luteus]